MNEREPENAQLAEEFKLHAFERESPGLRTSESEYPRNSIGEQLYTLKNDILEINEKFTQSTQLLKQKEEENRKLREKLLSLEITVQNLFDNTRSTGAGCCSQDCQLF